MDRRVHNRRNHPPSELGKERGYGRCRQYTIKELNVLFFNVFLLKGMGSDHCVKLTY